MFNRDDVFTHLPIEMWLEVFSYLNPEMVLKAGSINKQVQWAVHDNLFWQTKFQQHFPHSYNKPNRPQVLQWHHEFWETYNTEYFMLAATVRQIFSFSKEGTTPDLSYLPGLTLNDLDKVDSNGLTALEWAKKKGNQSLLNYFYKFATYSRIDMRRRNTLHWAILCQQSAALVTSLIALGTNVNAGMLHHSNKRNYMIQTIHLACMEGQQEVVQLLIEKCSALLNQTDSRNRTPLHWACKKSHAEVAGYLVKQGAKVDALSVRSLQAIHVASKNGNLAIVKRIVEAYPWLKNQTDAYGQTALLWAASRGHIDVVRYLAGAGADLDHPCNNLVLNAAGFTPLHWALYKGHIEIANFLIEMNARPDTASHEHSHMQPIHLACRNGYLDCVKLLLEKYPHLLNVQDAYGQTPVLWAASKGREEVVRYLAEQGADLDQQSNHDLLKRAGYTPLHWACKKGYTKTIRCLLENNAKIDMLNAKQKTPMDIGVKQSRYVNELKLLAYIKKTKQRKNDDYYYSFSLFGHRFNWESLGACPAQQKKKAAKALKEVYLDGEDESLLQPHQKALDNGELKTIYQGLKLYRK